MLTRSNCVLWKIISLSKFAIIVFSIALLYWLLMNHIHLVRHFFLNLSQVYFVMDLTSWLIQNLIIQLNCLFCVQGIFTFIIFINFNIHFFYIKIGFFQKLWMCFLSIDDLLLRNLYFAWNNSFKSFDLVRVPTRIWSLGWSIIWS